MTKTVLLGLTLAAILTMAIAFPAIADAITPIKQTEVKVKKGEISKLRFQLESKVETQPFGGYAILTDAGTAIAITSHAGFYDSEIQGETTPASPVIDFPGPAALCSSLEGCGAEWHVHVVEPAADDRCASNLKVGELTWTDPSDRLNVAGNNLIARGIALGANPYVAALSADGERNFDTGSNPGTEGLAFDLTPIFLDPEDLTSLDAVCIGPKSDSQLLCEDLGDGTRDDALVFIGDHNTGGDFRLDIDEFPYNDDIWNEANTNQDGATNASVVGGVELSNWFANNCN